MAHYGTGKRNIMNKTLKVLVHGTGFAGQGHADAFRAVGAEIVGIVGRTEHVTKDVAASMNIPYYSVDWEAALLACKPDIVSIGTPGGAHYEAIKTAIAHGCHVFCDKPLTIDGAQGKELHRLALEKGVKTAFAASFRYMPDVIHAKQLVAAGMIGAPQEVECISHFNLEKDIPFGWSHRKEEGGGRLNNNFTHKLSIVTSIIGEEILSVAGDVRDDLGQAPIIDGVHNFKSRRDFIPKDLDDPELKWGRSNVEWSYTVLAKIKSPFAVLPVSVLFKHGGLQPRFNEDHIAIYGSIGALYIKGHYGSGPLYHYSQGEWQELPLPTAITDELPMEIKGDTERNWRHLINLFVKDISGQPVEPYQTFAEGYLYQSIIDVIRENGNWIDVRTLQQ
jgi:predicted dehydrogenase